MKTSFLALGLATVATAAVAQDKPVLTVLTYDSFSAEWGPGPAVEKAFEETCACDLQFVAAGDGAALLSRIQMEGAGSDADIVLGMTRDHVGGVVLHELLTEQPSLEDLFLQIAGTRRQS